MGWPWRFCSSIFVGKMCIFVSRPMKSVTFLRKTVTTQNGLLIFLWKETHSETKSWKSSRILTKKVTTTTVNPGKRRGFCVCVCESKFLHISSFFFFIFHFFIFSFFFILSFFSSSFSSSFSSRPSWCQKQRKIVHKFLLVKIKLLGSRWTGGLRVTHLRVTSLSCFVFSFCFLGCWKYVYLGLNCFTSSNNISFFKKSIFWAVSGVPLWALFSCFLFFFLFKLMFFYFSFFLKKNFFSFFLYFLQICFLLAFVSEFNCFLRGRCSMEMWCPDDTGRDCWDWVGPPVWVRACFISPEWRGGSSPVFTEPPQIVLLLLLFQTRPWGNSVYVNKVLS